VRWQNATAYEQLYLLAYPVNFNSFCSVDALIANGSLDLHRAYAGREGLLMRTSPTCDGCASLTYLNRNQCD
jgi:hypothetical protein